MKHATILVFLCLLCVVEDSPEKLSAVCTKQPANCTVTIGNQVYTNVTERWEPRIGTIGAWLAIGIPTAYAVIALVVMMAGRRRQFGLKKIRTLYNNNMFLVNFAEYCGQEMYDLITKNDDPNHPHFDYFNNPEDFQYMVERRRDVGRGVYLRKYGDRQDTGVRACDVQKGKEFDNMFVSAKQLKDARKVLKYLQLPKHLALAAVVMTVFIMPMFKVVWDIIDVGVDCYYFVQLETGSLISDAITRNPHINNAVLVFAIMGCLKSTILGYGYSDVVRNSEGKNTSELTSHAGGSNFLKPVLVCLKITLEDGIELILEYFFVDKFVTENQPTWLIFKDVVTAGLYLVPLITILRSWRKNCEEVWGCWFTSIRTVFNIRITPRYWLHVYIACVAIHFTFGVATVVRVGGMIFQYSSMDVARECLAVYDGQLLQTPFNSSCLNGFDYIILVCMAIIAVLVVLVLFFVVINVFNKDINWTISKKTIGVLKKLDSMYKHVSRKFSSGYKKFDIDGHVSNVKITDRMDKLTYTNKHFAESVV